MRAPPLDDAGPEALIEAARQHLHARGAVWQANDPADPGLALLEAFAAVTSAEISRLNRLPTVLQGRFLAMLGARRRPGQADAARLCFTIARGRKRDVTLPAGLRVAAERAPELVFTLIEPTVIPAGETAAEGLAARVGLVAEAEVGRGTGAPAQRVVLPHSDLPGAPAAAAAVDVLVEWSGPVPAGAQGVDRGSVRVVRFREGTEGPCFRLDRAAGEITFAADGPVPPAGARIVASYCFRLPTESNDPLGPGQLNDLLDPLPGVAVTNPAAISPGHPAETPEALLARGPAAAIAADHAVRARDYEALALAAHPGVARAHAAALAGDWAFAEPGTVRVLIAPRVVADSDGAVGPDALAAAEAEELAGPEMLDAVRARLVKAAPLGVRIEVGWMPARAVAVAARLYVSPGADAQSIGAGARQALARLLCPLPGGLWPEGWPLGRPLRLSEVIETLSGVPGVRAVDRVELRPRYPMTGRVTGITVDARQPGTWFVAMGGALYRTLDGGGGWTRTPVPADAVVAVAAHPVRTGLVAAAGGDGAIYVSADCGQSFSAFAEAEAAPEQIVWADGSEVPRLLLAGPEPLAETSGPMADGRVPEVRVLTASDGPVGPAYAITTHPDGRGGRLVAVARRGLGGVLLSNDSGWDGGYFPMDLEGHDVRALAFLEVEDGLWLIAGCAAPVIGKRQAILGAPVDPDQGEVGDWRPLGRGWPGGSVGRLATDRDRIYAGTESQGLVTGKFAAGEINWVLPGAASGLPRRTDGTGAAGIGELGLAPRSAAAAPLMVGGDGHLFLSADAGDDSGLLFRDVAVRAGAERITLPADWALCPDRHEIEIRHVAE